MLFLVQNFLSLQCAHSSSNNLEMKCSSAKDVLAGKKKLRSPRRSLKPVDVASPVQTDGEVALFFSLHSDSSLKNRDGSDNFVNMAAQFNTAFHKQVSGSSNNLISKNKLRFIPIDKYVYFAVWRGKPQRAPPQPTCR